MKKLISRQASRPAGFTLVEIALAMLVISVGIVAILGLFPSGLEAGRRAENETRIALFAEDVLQGYKALSTVRPWAGLASDDLLLPGQDLWDGNLEVGDTGGQWEIIEFYPWDGEIPDYELRYRLEIEPVGNTLYQVRLSVLPGRYPEPDSAAFNIDDPDGPGYEKPYDFITEFFYTGIQ